MPRIRLTSEHPTVKAFEELCKKADEAGIVVSFYGHRTIIEHNGEEYDLVEQEAGEVIIQFPPMFETKLIREKD